MRCPRCLDVEVRYSFKAPGERVLTALLPISPFRCRGCRHRFWRLDRPVLSPSRGLAFGLVTLALVLGTLRAAGVLHGPTEDAQGSAVAMVPGPKTTPEESESGVSVAVPGTEASKTRTPPVSILTELGMEELEGAQAAEAQEAPVASPPVPTPGAAVAKKLKSPEVPSEAPPNASPKELHQGRLQRLRAVERSGNLEIEVIAGTTVRDFRSFSVENPRRLVVDLPGPWSSMVPEDLTMRHHLARAVRIGRHGDWLRLVVDLMPAAQSVPRVRPTSEGLIIEVRPVSLQPLPP